ncbi:MAG TPA: hypothetical protein VFQ53_01640 [Kofleriaceae bacterium]|nr:hypothetical protein [Kofleriaceae bacterium]
MGHRARVASTIGIAIVFLTFLTATKKRAPSQTANGVALPDSSTWPDVAVPGAGITVRLPPAATLAAPGATGFTVQLASKTELRFERRDRDPDTHALEAGYFPNEILYSHGDTLVVRFDEPRAGLCQLVTCSYRYPAFCVDTLKTKLRYTMADCVAAIAIAWSIRDVPEPTP